MATMTMWLMLLPKGMEEEFWQSSPELTSYYALADRWSWVTASIANYLFYTHIGAFYGWSQTFFKICTGVAICSVFGYSGVAACWPEWHRNHRVWIVRAMRIFRLILMIVANRLRDIPVYGTLMFRKQQQLLPSWLVVMLTLGIFTSLFPAIALDFHFPSSFRATVAVNALLVLFTFPTSVYQSMQLLHNENLVGIASQLFTKLFALAVSATGVESFVSSPSVEEPCRQINAALMLVLLVQVLSFAVPVWLAYCQEYKLKAGFLARRGIHVYQANLLEAASVNVLFVTVCFLVTCALQPVGRYSAGALINTPRHCHDAWIG